MRQLRPLNLQLRYVVRYVPYRRRDERSRLSRAIRGAAPRQRLNMIPTHAARTARNFPDPVAVPPGQRITPCAVTPSTRVHAHCHHGLRRCNEQIRTLRRVLLRDMQGNLHRLHCGRIRRVFTTPRRVLHRGVEEAVGGPEIVDKQLLRH